MLADASPNGTSLPPYDMPYTLWSKGTLLGTARALPTQPEFPTLFYEFDPTEAGKKAIATFNEVMRAGRGMMSIFEGASDIRADADIEILKDYSRRLVESPEGRRHTEAVRDVEELALQLIDDEGSVVPTTQLHIQDMLEIMQAVEPEFDVLSLEPGAPRFMVSAVLASPHP
ncbi:MAG: hypothetical protein JWO05_2540 [Gemmatimonadetes bacterium]|nr:hypothetical protein [Gemmatimonadota bacterium]